MTQRPSRRRVLQLTAASVGISLTGCVGGDGGSGGTPTAEATPTESMDTPTSTPTPRDEGTATPSVALSVADTDSQDGTVTIPKATIDKAGWLVIHPEASGGGPNGKVTLAERQLDAGTHTDISLTLNTLRKGDQTVYAMLHYENPADGEFTFPATGDPPVTSGGGPVVKPFTVTGTGTFSPALSVTDQEFDGTSLVVPQATIDNPGWLVIHPEASGGGPNGTVTLAERQLEPGMYRSIRLSLSETLSTNQTLYAMLHYDDPADGEFTFPSNGDSPVMSGGSPLVKPFSVSGVAPSSSALSVTDQQTDGTNVVVPQAQIDDPGWLVIHPEASGGGPNGGVTLAERQLDPGTYDSVELSLSETLSTNQTLYAMLHYDDPVDGEFTFPSNGDPPVTQGGGPLVKPFSVTITTTETVEMKNTSFNPMRLSVEPGTTVEWVNRDGFAHDVQSAQFHDNAASWDHYSGDLQQGDTTEFTFDETGFYEYYCTIHGKSTMCGVVLVGDVTLDKDLPCESSGGTAY